MKGSKIDTTGLPHHRILGQILYELICRESSGDGVRIAALRRELAADEIVARAYPHNLSKAISNSLRRLLWDGKIIREARGFYQVAPVAANQAAASTSANHMPTSSTAAAPALASAPAPTPAPAAGPSGSSASKGKTKYSAPSRTRNADDDELFDSEDESTSRKKPKLSSPLAYNGFHSLPHQYPDPRHGPLTTPYQPAPYYPHHTIEGHSTSRPSFGTSWERNPPPRYPSDTAPGHSYDQGPSHSQGYSFGYGQFHSPGPSRSPGVGPVHQYSLSHNTTQTFNQNPGHGYNYSYGHGLLASRPHHPGLYPAASQVTYEISTHFIDPLSSKGYAGPSSSGRYPQISPIRSPPPTGSRADTAPYTAIASSSSRGTTSYTSGGGSSSSDTSKPLSIANLLSRPTSPNETMRQQFSKRCPHLAKLVLEALQMLPGAQGTGVSTSAVRDWVSDRLGMGYGPVEQERRGRVGRAAELMLASLCTTNLAVETGRDQIDRIDIIAASHKICIQPTHVPSASDSQINIARTLAIATQQQRTHYRCTSSSPCRTLRFHPQQQQQQLVLLQLAADPAASSGTPWVLCLQRRIWPSAPGSLPLPLPLLLRPS
ncbi:hypothetical protein A4X09_0g858 [Tilletia walkeri]|uniref:Uncharacterized protein n=1 Tax=Tilletia walkeri TaxID=117179 RepID=A0A8X7NFC3_9BASI|nr:hypothetical protein A4X09_0g858 [Tilletia walkeri]